MRCAFAAYGKRHLMHAAGTFAMFEVCKCSENRQQLAHSRKVIAEPENPKKGSAMNLMTDFFVIIVSDSHTSSQCLTGTVEHYSLRM